MTEREKLNKKYDNIVEEKFRELFFSARNLFDVQDKGKSYYKTLEMFKYFFLQGEEAQMYLWNKLHTYVDSDGLETIDKNDFSADELQFLDSIDQACKSRRQKYGETFAGNVNINKPIATERLILTPFDRNLSSAYVEYFVQNKAEYEWYYNKEYDEDTIRWSCDPLFYKLSFAILLKDTNEYIGDVILMPYNTDVLYNIEYFIMPEHRHKGYAYEAVQQLLDEVVNDRLIVLEETVREGVFVETAPNIKCIVATIRADNATSIKFIEKLNFNKDGILKYHCKLYNKYYDYHVYTLEK